MKTISLLPQVSEFLGQDCVPLLIGGEWKQGSAGQIAVMDPASGEPITKVACANAADVDEAVKAAHAASAAWAATSPNERAVLMHRLADAVESEMEVLAQIESLDVGKAIAASRAFDIPFGAECLRYFADVATQAVYDIPLAVKNIEARTHRAPYGVCGFVFPWNFPFTLMCWGAAPALAAGNTVVIKVSEVTPLSSLYLARLAHKVGFPAGVINVVCGTGPEAGQPIVEHPLVKRMSFTGSSGVGKTIGRICGERLVPCKLELGGKGAAVVLPDADVAAAAAGLTGAITLNTGQVCCTATRWFLHDSVYDEFVDHARTALAGTRIGPGLDDATEMGPLVSKAQLDRVTDYYQKGLADGAQALVECSAPESAGGGYFVTPHLLAGTDDNVCFREEVFGPTAFLVKYSDPADAVERVNRVPYGLANSVWGTDLGHVNQIAEQIVAGNSWINAHNVFAYGLPYGGVNESGTGGGVNSVETFNDYLRNQTIARPL